jgi:predicted metalloprotease with PDZ domain
MLAGRFATSVATVFVSILIACTAPVFAAPPLQPMLLHVDATHASQGLVHVDLIIPVKPGPLTLDYPKWIPGEHGPTGSTMNIGGLTFSANGQTLPWRRDLVEVFQFHLTVPDGVTSLDVSFDYIDNIGATGRWESDQESTPSLAVLSFSHFIFYPDGELSLNILVTADVTFPEGWQYATAMEPSSSTVDTVQFKTTSLYTLCDSPILTGAYFHKFALTPLGVVPTVELDVAADNPDDFKPAPADKIQDMKNLVAEETTMFGSEHYRHYNFLYCFSDHIAENGLEHSESNESAFPEDVLTNDKDFADNADTPGHEYFHSWNGKYRRPFDLATPDLISPEKTDLLWVYEGLTQYYGFVFATRSGLLTQDQCRDAFAAKLSFIDNETGRNWRSLQDTADDAQELYDAPNNGNLYRRNVDFYEEGAVDWFGADTIIRKQTSGKKSLDDFCRLFYSQPERQITAPVLEPYTEADVIEALNAVCPYDWQGYWDSRLNSIGQSKADQWLNDAGWSLVYSDTDNPRDFFTLVDKAGFGCGPDGTVSDVEPGSIALADGLAPGQQIIAVNGRPFSNDVLLKQLVAAEKSTNPVELIVEEYHLYKVIELDYHSGLKYPHLQRLTSRPDLLTQILSPIPIPGAAVPNSVTTVQGTSN